MTESAAKTRAGGYRFVVEAVALALQVSIGLSFMAPAPLFPVIIDTYSVNRASVSLLVGAVTLIQAIFSMPASVVAAKVGLKRAYAVGGLLMSAGLLTPFASSFPTLLALRVLFGLGASFIVPLTGAIIMQWFDSQELPLINSINIVGQSVGVTISMFATVVIGESFGWQAPLTLYGGVALLSALGWIILGRERRDAAGSPQAASFREIASILSQKNTLLLGMGLVGSFGLYVTLSSWLPAYYNEALGMPLATASTIAGLLPLIGIGGSILGGVLATRVGLRRPFIMFSGAVTAAAAVGTYINSNGSLEIIYVSAAIVGLCAWLYLPSAFTIPMELPNMSPEKVGVMLATAMGMGSIAGFGAPLITGFIADVTGSYIPGFLLWTITSLALLASGYLLPETGPRAKITKPVVEKVVAGPERP